LAGILDPSPCATFAGPCIDQTVFGPTVALAYWSATTYAPLPIDAFLVGFYKFPENPGNVYLSPKDNYAFPVRAVRSGL